MHGNGQIHRDLKPENILMVSSDLDNLELKITDFGFSCFYVPGDFLSACGSPLFMAPEVLMRKKDFNEKADIFSIGVITYNLITGDDLFDVSSLEELKLKVCNYDPNYDGFSEFVTP